MIRASAATCGLFLAVLTMAAGQEQSTAKPALANAPAKKLNAAQQTALAAVDAREEELKAVNKAIWDYAELGLEEH